jgi:hypothetical protein
MKITLLSLAFALLLASGGAWAGDAGLSLQDAVIKVQQETGGKVLSAGTIERGRFTEYRVKVLTLDGHVRVVPIRTETAKIPNQTDRDNKEKD